jgi:rhodanese-related sulfurtransferase
MITLCMGLACAMAAGLLQLSWAADHMNDTEKRDKIEAMYQGYRKDFPGVQDIDPSDAMRLLQEGKALFIDVREAREQQVSMLPGAVTEKQFLKDPDRYRDRTLIGYCTISYRSGKLAEKLKAQGLTLLNLKGGLLAWVHAGGKVYDQNGETKRIHVYGKKWNLGPKGYEAVW